MTNNPDQKETTEQQALRRKLLRWGGLGSIALFAGLQFRNIFSFRKAGIISCVPAPQMVKMLTQEGKLVSVDVSKMIGEKRKKITEDQLKKFVSKSNTKPGGLI